MSSGVTKIGAKYLVHVDILRALGAELEKLPPKEKILFDFKSAVDFLRPFLELALEKNYTKDEIFDLMVKVGWRITRNKFKRFWELYLLEDENSVKKKNHIEKSSRKNKTQKNKSELSYDFSADESKNEAQESDLGIQDTDIEKDLSQESTNENHEIHKSSNENSWHSISAYFHAKPDTEDL